MANLLPDDLEILAPGAPEGNINLATKDELENARQSISKATLNDFDVEEEKSSAKTFKPTAKRYVEEFNRNESIDTKKGKSKNSDNEVIDGYSVMLNLTDISYGEKGHNKYYQIQIQKKNGHYCLFTKWGRVGAKNPQSKLQEYDSKIQAIHDFKKKFREKTMNDWDDKDHFHVRPGKYSMIGVEATANSSESMNEEITKLNKRNNMIKRRIKENKSNLEESVRSLMEMIWDINRMNRTLRGS